MELSNMLIFKTEFIFKKQNAVKVRHGFGAALFFFLMTKITR